MPVCGDGLVVGKEICDDALKGGCLSTCEGPNTNFECKGGSLTSPSECYCTDGYEPLDPICILKPTLAQNSSFENLTESYNGLGTFVQTI